ncbi:MAG: TonB-dependent receptor [Bacteroidetes bacterium]|nr:TonB-dependent receptor [Bacteroidota bacterium]
MLIFCFQAFSVFSQHATVSGRITDSQNRPLELVTIAISGQPGGTTTSADGRYSLQIPASRPVKIVITLLGYETDSLLLNLAPGIKETKDRTLKQKAVVLNSLVIEDRQLRSTNLNRINPRVVSALPSAGSGVESLIKTMPGVVSNNELSSQYSVRGGNYDENLIYVNDIEIYKPFLVHASQQEGLSFLNSDLVSSILFSAGGFDAKYGDRLSSTLDIRYKHPRAFAASATGSLLGTNVHVEGASDDTRFTYLVGARYKTIQYLLNSMETKGSYKPVFLDLQSLLSYNLNEHLELSLLTYLSSNTFTVIPESRETNFGTLFEPLRLTMFFDGRESDKYKSMMSAITLTDKPNKNLQVKWITSAYRSIEQESYDIQAQYWINLLSNKASEGDSIEVIEAKGYGEYITHARNKLDMTVMNMENRYSWVHERSFMQWGVKYQKEIFHDKLKEWYMVDSAQYILPYNPGVPGDSGNQASLYLKSSTKSSADLNSNRYTAFVQNTWDLDGDSTRLAFTIGARLHYWDFNKQLLFSPRATLSYKPNWKKDIMFRLSSGMYYQPPFYRELHTASDTTIRNVKAQESIHFVLGSDWNFTAWHRPFKFVSEVYYKILRNLDPYEVDNVRIQYMGANNSKGYAVGIDMKVNGEFVKGVESWASLSVMRTREDILDDSVMRYYNAAGKLIRKGITTDNVAVDSSVYYPGYFPRPTDQLVTFGMFFQDYLPSNPSYKMNVGIFFGTGLPTGAPGTQLYTHTVRMSPYRRVDIGLAKQIIGPDALHPHSGFFKNFKNLWFTFEILNLLQVSNTVSYNWVRDFNGNQYSVPNYLTPRQINIRLSAEL